MQEQRAEDTEIIKTEITNATENPGQESDLLNFYANRFMDTFRNEMLGFRQ